MVHLSDIFRSIFGPPKEQFGTNDIPRDIQEDLENLYGRRPDKHRPSEPPSDEQWRMSTEGQHPEQGHHEDIFQFGEEDFLREFEQMFQNMFRRFPFHFNPPTQGFPTIDPPPDLSSETPQENFPSHAGSLRDRMLKGPESSLDSGNFRDQQNDSQSEGSPLFRPFSLFDDLWRIPFGGQSSCPDQRVDRDLDSEINMGTHSLDDILSPKDDSQTPQQAPHFSSSSSFSSVTIVDSNGVTEKRTTRRDSSGKEEVVITRRIGDQTHTVTRRKDSCGNEETHVDIVNNDKDGYAGSSSSQQLTPLSSIYESILEQFFPKRR